MAEVINWLRKFLDWQFLFVSDTRGSMIVRYRWVGAVEGIAGSGRMEAGRRDTGMGSGLDKAGNHLVWVGRGRCDCGWRDAGPNSSRTPGCRR